MSPKAGEEDIDALVKDAELHAEEDKCKKVLITARNQADQLIYQTEKVMSGSQIAVDADTRSRLEGLVNELKEAVKSENVNRFNTAADHLNQAVSTMSQAAYARKQGPGGASGPVEPQAVKRPRMMIL